MLLKSLLCYIVSLFCVERAATRLSNTDWLLAPRRKWLFVDSLTHWGRDKMAAVSQTTLSIAFSWMKMFEFKSLKFVPEGPINFIPALVQIMAWRRPGDKPLSELMMVSLLTHICVIRPQWVNKTMIWYVFQRKCLDDLISFVVLNYFPCMFID